MDINQLPEKLQALIAVQENGCWHFTGRLTNHGYGVIGSNHLVHRLVAALAYGDIPKGMWVDHICHNADHTCQPKACMHRRCCNPDHLRIVTPKENLHATPNSPAFINAQKTHCKNGHELSGYNLYTYIRRGNPVRFCRACGRAATERFRAKKAA